MSHISDDLPDDLIGLADAAALIPSQHKGKKTCTITVTRFIQRGLLRGWRLAGRRWLVSRREVLGLFELVRTSPRLQQRAQQDREDAETDRILREEGIRN